MRRLLNWLSGRRGKLEGELERELRYHLDRRTSDLITSGLAEDEARRRANLELGGAVRIREDVRDEWLIRWVREFFYDLRFATRSLLRSPSFTVTAVLSLALGIGATTALYSLVDQVMLRMLPIHQPERLVLVDWVGENLADGWGSGSLMSYPICRDLQLQDRFFDGVVCRHPTTMNLSTGSGSKPAAGEIVSGSYFRVLGVGPAVGRIFRDDDDWTPGAHPVIVLSHDFWRSQFSGEASVVGRKVLVNGHPMTVIGVARAGFRGLDIGEVPAFWIPAAMKAQATPGWDRLWDRRARWLHVFGRLKRDVTLEQAQAGLQPWFKTMLKQDTLLAGFPTTTAEQRKQFLASTLRVRPSPQGRSGLRNQLAQPLWVLFAATGVLLALACSNVAGLFLARGSARDREIVTRMAVGASRGRIARQLLADSILIAIVGGLLGTILAPVAAQGLISFLPREAAGVDLEAAIDGRLLLFAFSISSCAGILCGMAPALQSGRLSLIGALRDRAGSVLGSVRLRKALVTAQVAFALVLVIGAALFGQTLVGLLSKGPGFPISNLVSFGLEPGRNGYSDVDAQRLIRRIDVELAALPAVQRHAIASVQLLRGGSWNGSMTIQGQEKSFTNRSVHLNGVSPGFFEVLGIRMVAGRPFSERDSLPLAGDKPSRSGVRAAIVNESFARRYFGGRSPLGSHLGFGVGPDTKTNIEIVGVVADFSYRGLREESEQAYFPMMETSSGNFYVRVRGDAKLASQSIRALVQRADPNLPLDYFRTLDEQVNRSLNTERLLATVCSAFGAMALLLSLVGLYGVMSYVVTQRTREIGVRLALGATRSSAVWLVLRDAFTMIAAGTAIALPCVWGLGRLVQSQLFGVSAADPVTIASASLLLGLVAMGAALIPAYRASTVNPTDALRFE